MPLQDKTTRNATRSSRAGFASSTRIDVSRGITFFRERFRELGTAERAVGEKAYLKSPLQFHGVTIPDIRRVCAAFGREHPGLGREELHALVDGLFATDYHDLRSAGVCLLEMKRGLLEMEDLPRLLDLVRRSPNWAHVDWLATKVIGPIISGAVDRGPILRAWAKDGDMWVRRTALLAQHDALRAGGGDFALFAEIAASMLGEREFFIRKAIGWVLREVSKKRPELAYGFLRDHRAEVSGLTLREGAKHLPSTMRAELQSR